jgi:hypothetical protein
VWVEQQGVKARHLRRDPRATILMAKSNRRCARTKFGGRFKQWTAERICGPLRRHDNRSRPPSPRRLGRGTRRSRAKHRVRGDHGVAHPPVRPARRGAGFPMLYR